jgi:hypothetical protein
MDESRHNTPTIRKNRSRYHEDHSYTGSPDQDRRRSIGKVIGQTSRQQSRSPSESYSSSPKPKKAC